MAVTVGTVRKGRSSDGVTSQAGGRREDRDMTKGSQRPSPGDAKVAGRTRHGGNRRSKCGN